MLRVLVPIAEGFEEIEAISIIDVLRRAGIEVIMGSLNENLLVKGANGITVHADCPIKGICADELDMIVLPGGWGGTKALADDTGVQNLLKEMNSKGKNIGAICAAPYALYTAGVLREGYTCYPSVEDEINVAGYLGDADAVVQTGNIMTSRGPGTAICFGLAIVKKLLGDETSEKLRGGLLADYCASI
ncbi:MAG: thiamine biosynthesis protein ThiJ [Sulfuricurvum sp. GWF2_44_89]|uniref:DJ-1 family protein n=1 Tax=Sulfuricurvum kujiense TaxID=148813 RepID=A0A2D3WMU7_9BACT|nr:MULTISPECIES: DJ-1 family glyoxalase III [Sulfuricurvum]OHD77230.1 MAG: thiamine biosynthesis protein ThiJ [Sulfuricurvum sp. GWF2_44_89]OHD96171.1 MAG: thiamine biosynthesis protein ThiJ [Sulfuricurvum sp. RIFOXYD12_FULL_44_77]OHE00022.1 MAG: thiamine biosynthesis protein ThiJ [Sulfuricurvum sp. RIFOXYD2_FULL_44_160]DAB37893.1 MAG TPA: DJ-1 family protein [Sulfuricurvum kujiense]